MNHIRKTWLRSLNISAAAILLLWGSSCKSPSVPAASGTAEKSVSGSGTLMIQKVGFNRVDQSPEFFNLMVWGDYTSIAGENELLRYEALDDSSIFNSNARTKHRKLFFASTDPARMDQVIRSLQKHLAGSAAGDSAGGAEIHEK